MRNAQNTVIFVFVPIFAQGKVAGLRTECGRHFLAICLPSKTFVWSCPIRIQNSIDASPGSIWPK